MATWNKGKDRTNQPTSQPTNLFIFSHYLDDSVEMTLSLSRLRSRLCSRLGRVWYKSVVGSPRLWGLCWCCVGAGAGDLDLRCCCCCDLFCTTCDRHRYTVKMCVCVCTNPSMHARACMCALSLSLSLSLGVCVWYFHEIFTFVFLLVIFFPPSNLMFAYMIVGVCDVLWFWLGVYNASSLSFQSC